MNIFSDLHHSGLYYSLHLLFEKRLGHKLYRPIGEEWFEREYWKIAEPYKNHPATIKQYLSLDQRFIPSDGTPPLNSVVGSAPTHYEIEDLAHGFTQKAITFEQFNSMPIDLIIASIPSHWRSHNALQATFKPKAKVICQLGNIYWEDELALKDGTVKNLLASTMPFATPSHVNTVFYHQEQPLVEHKPVQTNKKIYSFVNCLPEPELFEQFKKSLPGFEVKAYGASCPDGWVNGIVSQYEKMQEADIGFHNKPHGDGYGWVWHSWFMLGRGVITRFSDYKDKLGGLLFEDMVTGIDLDKHSIDEVARLIQVDPKLIETIGNNARERFCAVVDYAKEQQEIKAFLGRLQ